MLRTEKLASSDGLSKNGCGERFDRAVADLISPKLVLKPGHGRRIIIDFSKPTSEKATMSMADEGPQPIKPTGRRYPSALRRPTRQPTTLIAIAHHEAGHAVVSRKLRFKIKQVTIVPKGEAAGSVTWLKALGVSYNSGITGESIGRHHDRVVALLAGVEAQRRFKPQSIRRYQTTCDYSAAADFLLSLHGEEKERNCASKYLQARTRNLVSNPVNWRFIQDLAKALLERQTLTGKEVNDVIQASKDAQMEESRARTK
jgi:hypothetical protein